MGFPGGTSSKEHACDAGDVREDGSFNPWVRKGATPVFLPGESHGQRSLAGYSSWDRKESDMT